MIREATIAFATLALAAVTWAGDGAADAGRKSIGAARGAYSDYVRWIESHPVPSGDDRITAWLRERERHAFLAADAFGATDWADWKLPDDDDLVWFGLTWFAVHAEREGRWKDARRAYEWHLENFTAKPETAVRIRRASLPDVVAAAGDLGDALARCLELQPTLPPYAKAASLLRSADLRSALGDAKAAAADLRAVSVASSAWDGKSDEFDGTVRDAFDLRRAMDNAVSLRGALLGKNASLLGSPVWIGAPSTDWPHLGGRILVFECIGEFDRWDAWTDRVEALDRFARTNADRPVRSFVLMHPGAISQEKPSPQTEARGHATSIRERLNLSVPVLIVSDDVFEKTLGSPRANVLLVADAQRRIVQVNGGMPGRCATLGIAQVLTDRLASAAPPTPK